MPEPLHDERSPAQDLSPYGHLSDEELILLFRESGNQEIIGTLFRRYTHLVLGFCIRYLRDRELARDTSMGVFESLFSSLKKYEVTHFKSWLFTVVRSHCAQALRNHKKSPLFIPWEENLMREVMEIDRFSYHNDVEETEDQIRELYLAVGELSPGQHQCVVLFYLEGKSYSEIAEATGYSMNEVKSFIQNGKRNLKNRLEKKP